MQDIGDWIPVLGMILSLLLTLIIGGFIVVYPVTRRLGAALEEWVRIRREARPLEGAVEEIRREVGELSAHLSYVSSELEDLRERQRFAEQLQEGRAPNSLEEGRRSP